MSFIIEDSLGEEYYCYSHNKIKYPLNTNDQLILYGRKKNKKNKVLYIQNSSQNYHVNLIYKYYLTNFIFSIIFLGLSMPVSIFLIYMMITTHNLSKIAYIYLFICSLIVNIVCLLGLFMSSYDLIADNNIKKKFRR